MRISSKSRPILLGGVAAAALTGSLLAGGVVSPVTPVYADAVKVQAPQAPSFADVVEAVSPAVVSVRVKAAVEPASSDGRYGFDMEGLPENHPFRRFFGERFGQRGEGRGERRRRGGRNFGMSQGSGFFVSEDGYLVTNNHVIERGKAFTVVLSDGEELDATLVGADPRTDLAVLKVEDKREFTYVEFTDAKSRVGDWVVAVGNPFGLGGTVTAGIVSASNRDIGSGPYDDFIQIDAAVNKGNSGGPAFNLSGEVIGVNTAIFSPSGGNVGIAFAISARSASEVVKELIDDGSITRGWLGVQIQPVTQDIAESLDLDGTKGTLVTEAQPDSPAEEAGLRSGDVITEVDGETVEGPRKLARTIASMDPDQTVKVTVVRDGRTRTIDVKLGTLPGQKRMAKAETAPKSRTGAVDIEQLGISVAEGSEGVVIADVQNGSAAEEKRMQRGDVVVAVNGKKVKTPEDVAEALAQAMEEDRKAVLFRLKSGERSRFVAVPVQRG